MYKLFYRSARWFCCLALLILTLTSYRAVNFDPMIYNGVNGHVLKDHQTSTYTNDVTFSIPREGQGKQYLLREEYGHVNRDMILNEKYTIEKATRLEYGVEELILKEVETRASSKLRIDENNKVIIFWSDFQRDEYIFNQEIKWEIK
jgi:hypothetical protein